MVNYKRNVDLLLNRFTAQTMRHERLIDVWVETTVRAEKAEELLSLELETSIAKDMIIDLQLEKIDGFKGTTRKEKRKSWKNGAIAGSVGTVVVIAVLSVFVFNN